VQLDALFPFDTKLSAIPQLASAAEEMGFSAAWLAETSHNPFLASALVTEHTSRLKFGTGIAVSFARSPAVLAHEAWDLADFSSGRFLLGLGTQIKAHIERRFGMSWPESPVNKLREQIEVMHAFWQHWP
jgi:alkanesulfonate monooxygenase SsuD/methylene tetrahydromethanopterin reductase-like flavin-dependent oxidoreductase (luciferase family)